MLTRKNRIIVRKTLKTGRPRFINVRCGLQGQIRTRDISGVLLISRVPTDIQIDGCDWYGALSIYFNIDAQSPLISNGPAFYFMTPDSEEEAVFLAMFHHLHNLLLLQGQGPPFQSPLQEKYEFLRSLALEDTDEFAGLSVADLDSLLQQIQRAAQVNVYASWSEFRAIFQNPWLGQTLYTPEERLAALGQIIANAGDLLRFMSCSIETFAHFTLEPCGATDKIELICSLVLRKLDCHEIYVQTGVKPKETNWIQELDYILKSGL
jgi:hypothetical protein